MTGGRIRVTATAASLIVAVALATVLARPAAANHSIEEDELWVTVAINAAGGDRLSVTDDTFATDRSWTTIANQVAVALGHPEGTFHAYEDYDSAYVELDDKLAQPDEKGRFSWALDTGDLQLVAQEEGYEILLLEVCTPRVRQAVDALVSPESPGFDGPGSRCRGWFQFVEDPPIRAVVELSPNRDRYPRAVGRAAGAAAIAFGLLGIGATLLRRGPMRRRSVGSWVLSVGSAVVVGPIGWVTVTMVMWWNGSAADPVLLSRGSIGEQVARTMLPGLAFALPALLPAGVLLTVPRKEKPPPAPPPVWPGQPAPGTTWWPQAWWPAWAAQHPEGRPYPPPPPGVVAAPDGRHPPVPPGTGPVPPAPPEGSSGWATPGSSGG